MDVVVVVVFAAVVAAAAGSDGSIAKSMESTKDRQ